MNAQHPVATARAPVAGDKGLLAMDESKPTCNKRVPFAFFFPRGSHSVDPATKFATGGVNSSPP